MCLNCPIPWEAASLGDDWSPTWVEGLVDKLPPAWDRGSPKYFCTYRRVGLLYVSGCCYDVYIHPLEKEQL
jgi:hypothetical protein